MLILKFGGTSVGSPAALQQVKAIIEKHKSTVIEAVVVSAFSGVTNLLIETAEQAANGSLTYLHNLELVKTRHRETASALFPAQLPDLLKDQVELLLAELSSILNGVYLLKECSPRSLDLVMSFGEKLSATIISAWLRSENIDNHFLDTRDVITTDHAFGHAKPDYNSSLDRIRAHFGQQTTMAVATGFIGATPNGETTTLGRGGSDFTASILAAGLNPTEILIYTDVNGMMTADPKQVRNAFTMRQISYEEAMELSHFGAKVIYPPTLQPAIDRHIPIRICNTFQIKDEGTLITATSQGNTHLITGLSAVKEVALVNVQGTGLAGNHGFAGKLFTALAAEKINIILITQASSEHSISFAIEQKDATRARAAIENAFASEIKTHNLDPIEIREDVAIVAIIGENMRKTPGVSGRIFSALGRNGINVMATAQGSSELNISVVVQRADLTKALNALHQRFFTNDLRQINLFLVGPGLIGKTLLQQILQQKEFLAHNKRLEVKLMGVANSRNMRIEPNGIPLTEWQSSLENQAEPANLKNFIDSVIGLNLPNSVVVDCTAGTACLPYYQPLLAQSIAVITPNKLANSGTLETYKQLKATALGHNTRFCYETNVGAGLPVIQTLQNLISSGDRIFRIEAILSGTLSYIFNQFKPGVPFWQVVKQAKDLGYTEPDPRDDLSGRDIARKILILARETGLELEPDDVVPQNILPKACTEAATVDDFFEALKAENSYFEKLVTDADLAGRKIKFICKLEDGKVKIGLEEIGPDHPFWNTSGADNILAFFTTRYATRPMVIQGPGAGAEVTAAGVFGEMIALVV